MKEAEIVLPEFSSAILKSAARAPSAGFEQNPTSSAILDVGTAGVKERTQSKTVASFETWVPTLRSSKLPQLKYQLLIEWIQSMRSSDFFILIVSLSIW